MHPAPYFAWNDRDAMLAMVAEIGFCTICLPGPFVAHAPVLVAAPDRLRFHLARRNRAVPALEAGARAIVSCLGPDAYVSADWYGSDGQVPTWNYVAVEAEGPLRRLDEPELADLLDALSAEFERRLAPKPPWTSAKLGADRLRAMLEALAGFELTIEALRGTRKLAQHKSRTERKAVAAALASSSPALARAMRDEPMQDPPPLDGDG